MDTNQQPEQPSSVPVGEPVSPLPPVTPPSTPAPSPEYPPAPPTTPPPTPPSEPPAPVQSVHHGPNPALILGIIMVLVLGASAAAFAFLMKSKPAAPVETTVQPTAVPQPVTPTAVIPNTADLEAKPIPQSDEDISAEIELLDETVNDGAESEFSETTLQGIEE